MTTTARVGRHVHLKAVTALVALSGIGACGTGPEGDTVEQRALGTFPGWSQMPPLVLEDAPALARATLTNLTAFGLANDFQIYQTHQITAGSWAGASWSLLSGGRFASIPRVVAPSVTSGNLFNTFAIVALKSDGRIYLRIQNQSASTIVEDWTAVNPNQTFFGPPAIGFVPSNSQGGPLNTLVIFARGTDNRLYWAKNALGANNTYNPTGWTTFGPIGNPSQTINSAPAVTYSCGNGNGSIVVSALAGSSFEVLEFFYPDWLYWGALPGPWASAPALSLGCGEFSHEITLWARENSGQVVATTQISSGNGTLHGVGNQLFDASPEATGFGTTVYVSAINTDGVGFTNSTSSP
jgi:hypothetical protein